MTGLETTYSVLVTAMPDVSQDRWIELLAINPRKLFNLPPATIQQGQKACITLFDPAAEWTVNDNHFKSKSKNSPFAGKKLKGKVAGIINGDKIVMQ